MSIPDGDLQYITSLEEISWGATLVAVTLAMHGVGMVGTLAVSDRLKLVFAARRSFIRGIAVIILASWMIILVHLVEVFVWAAFFLWCGAMPTASRSYYFALMDYTTLGCEFNLPLRWRLLEGMIAIGGLMTFAWSTGVLFTMAQDFQDQELQLVKRRRQKRAQQPAPPPVHGSGEIPG